jgi:hypothetical protein
VEAETVGTSVNEGKKEGRSCYAPAPRLDALLSVGG